jgi:hypothetical protein
MNARQIQGHTRCKTAACGFMCALQAAAELDASTKLPADTAAQQPARIAVGSLDINQGAVLPAEDLVGRLPTVSRLSFWKTDG